MKIRFLQCRLVEVFTLIKRQFLKVTVRTKNGTEYAFRFSGYNKDNIPFCFNNENDTIISLFDLEYKTPTDTDLLIPILLKKNEHGKLGYHLVYNDSEVEIQPKDCQYIVSKDQTWTDYFSGFHQSNVTDKSAPRLSA